MALKLLMLESLCVDDGYNQHQCHKEKSGRGRCKSWWCRSEMVNTWETQTGQEMRKARILQCTCLFVQYTQSCYLEFLQKFSDSDD